jgi:transposase-like protein
MSRPRRKFEREFRDGAVRIVQETGRPVVRVARDFGTNEGTLGYWVPHGRGERSGGLTTHDRAELARLCKENATLRPSRPVVFFANSSSRGGLITLAPIATEMFGGIDTHKHAHVAAAVDAARRCWGAAEFSADTAGYRKLLGWLGSHGPLVRGLDYYIHSTWEFAAGALTSAQNAVGGGGRYDGLAESLGGKPAPGVGFGAGIERILLAADAEDALMETAGGVDVFVVDVTGGDAGRDLTFELRRHGISADRAFDARSMKAQMKVADRSGARLALLVGDDELEAGTVTLRDLRSGEGQTEVPRAEVVAKVTAQLAEGGKR